MQELTKGEKKFKEAQQKIKDSKCFVVVMSRGGDIHIDEEELPKVIKARQEGKDVRVKQGLINMAFYVQIKEDDERKKDSLDENFNYQFQIEQEHREPKDKLLPLKDIFKDMKLLPGGEKPKQLK